MGDCGVVGDPKLSAAAYHSIWEQKNREQSIPAVDKSVPALRWIRRPDWLGVPHCE